MAIKKVAWWEANHTVDDIIQTRISDNPSPGDLISPMEVASAPTHVNNSVSTLTPFNAYSDRLCNNAQHASPLSTRELAFSVMIAGYSTFARPVRWTEMKDTLKQSRNPQPRATVAALALVVQPSQKPHRHFVVALVQLSVSYVFSSAFSWLRWSLSPSQCAACVSLLTPKVVERSLCSASYFFVSRMPQLF